MDAKGECEEITYPKIYFAIDSFDEVFNDMIVGEGECICVELVARDRYRNSEAVIFLGSIRYDILKKLYDSRNSGTWNWAQRWMNSGKQRHEFVKMRGPKGKGFAEMAVTKVASCGFETPMSERGGFMGYDAQFCSQRRMSDTGGLFSRLLYGSTYSAATTPSVTVPRASRCSTTPGPGPPPSVTPTLFTSGQRTTSRWYSGDVAADNDGSDLESAADAQSLAGHAVSGGGGMSTPNWSMRGLGSALQLLKDRNQQPDQLQAFLTYITLPWISILEDILSPSSRKPILTFDLQLQKPPPPS